MTNPLSSPQESPGGQETPEAALRKIDIFSDLSDDQLQWFVSSADEISSLPGTLSYTKAIRRMRCSFCSKVKCADDAKTEEAIRQALWRRPAK